MKFCPQCGLKLPHANVNFCPECGCDLASFKESEPAEKNPKKLENEPKKEPSSKPTLWPLIAFVSCIVLALIMGFAIKSHNAKNAVPDLPSCGQAWVDHSIRYGMSFEDVVKVIGEPSEVWQSNGEVNTAFWRGTGYYISNDSKQPGVRKPDTSDYTLCFSEGRLVDMFH